MKEYTVMEMALCHSSPFQLPTEMSPCPFLSPTQVRPLQALPSALKSSHGSWVLVGRGPLRCLTKGPAPAWPQSPGASTDQPPVSHFVSAHDAVANMVILLVYVYLVCLCLYVLCPGEMKPKNPMDGASTEGTRARQSQPEHAQVWFGSNSYWLLISSCFW